MLSSTETRVTETSYTIIGFYKCVYRKTIQICNPYT